MNVGSAHRVNLSSPEIEKGEFIAYADDESTILSAEKDRTAGTKWSLKLYPSKGGNTFRIEEHGGVPHVNTADKDYDHIALVIPGEHLETYAAVGSAAGLYYEPEEHDVPTLMMKHFNFVVKD